MRWQSNANIVEGPAVPEIVFWYLLTSANYISTATRPTRILENNLFPDHCHQTKSLTV